MTEIDREPFAELYMSLCRGFDKKPDSAIAAEYFAALSDYPLQTVERAKLDLIRGSKFWPKVVDWRRACDTVRASTPTPSFALSKQQDDGTITSVYCCANCQDSGWRPACGCRFGEMDGHGMCPRHPRVENGGMVYRQAMVICACRDANPAYQAQRPKVTGAARDAGNRDAA